MKKLNRILAIIILILATIGIMVSAGVMYSYATVMAENNVNNVIVNNEVVIGSEENKKTENKVIEDKTTVKQDNNNNKANQTQKVNKTTKNSNNVTKQQYSLAWIKEINNKVAELQKEFPKGYYWNHAGKTKNGSVTTTPCNHKEGKCYCNVYDSKSTKACGFKVGRQCAGFASMLSDRVFGKDAPVRIFYNYDEIRVGDQARINNNSHTVFIIEKTDDYVVVAECNADYKTCVINWGRKIPRNQLKGFYLTRW